MKDKPTILYLDDEVENLIGFEVCFSKDYNVKTALDIPEAINLIESGEIQIALVDYRLQNENGLSFIKEIKNKFPEVVFIIVTAYIEIDAIITEINKHGIFGYVQKPWEYNTLKMTIQNARESYRLRSLNNCMMNELEHLKNEAVARQNFFAKINHDIRTPMTGIIGLTELLLSTSKDEQQHEYLNAIKESSLSLTKILDDVLLLSKINAEKLKLNPSAVSVSKVVRDVQLLFHTMLKEKGLMLRVEMPKDILQCMYLDENRLKQILNNLISNAIKFTQEGSITLRVGYSEKSENSGILNVEVEDTGIGIEKNEIDRIFDSFVQIDNSLSKQVSGTGLGLAICKKIVNQMGGEISITSEPEKGTKVCFDILVEKTTECKEEKYIEKEKASQIQFGLNVLVAEDVVTNQKVIKLILEKHGCKIKIVENGQQVIDEAINNKYDLVLMDIQMPIIDGVTATKAIKEQMQDAPKIVALSANVNEKNIEQLKAIGFDDCIAKPIDMNKISEMLATIAQGVG